MADYFQSSPNFVNPSYSTPEQLAAARAYATELSKRSGEKVNRPTGAIANVLDAFTSVLTRNRADRMQQEAAQGNARDMTDLVTQMQAGKLDPQTLGTMVANPMISPEQRALAIGLMNPKGVEDVYGRPGYASPAAGVQAAPVQGNFQPGYRAPVQAEGVGTTAPIPAPGPVTRAPVPSTSRVWGDEEAKRAGLYPSSSQPTPGGGGGTQAAASPGSPPASYLPPQVGGTVRELAGLGREVSAQRTVNAAGAGAQGDVVKQDITTATQAQAVKRIAGIMLDDLKTHGDKMTFGPTAEWSNNIKKIAANYAPGLMRDRIESLASADSFDKMSAQLTSMLGSHTGTDAQLFNNMRSVPGAHNSKEGAEALLNMVLQVADQDQKLGLILQNQNNWQNYPHLKSEFYRNNPVINPITGNPISQDLLPRNQAAPTGGGGARIISVRPAQ